ncbi:ComEA family DNA-binding protein [Candidatus Microgenomates bacterium]|nr:ComEA family DNA-binding protein [Candidatus Microgenomates bacterium]
MPNIDWESTIVRFRWQIIFLLIGLLLIGGGIVASKLSLFNSPKVEVLGEQTSENNKLEIVVEIEGQVIKPGVYHLPFDSRIEDLLTNAGGLTNDADKDWVEKNLNRAAKLTDGQKLYIPSFSEQSKVSTANQTTTGVTTSNSISQNSQKLININTATLSQLDTLSQIGPVSAQKIIDNRPYSTIEDLVNKKVISQKTLDANKDKISVY